MRATSSSRASADNFVVLSKDQQAKRYQLKDLGPSLEYNFLVFNQNDLTGKNVPRVAAKQPWFNDVNFRRAVSLAIDRQGITRLVFKGLAVPLWGNVSPGNHRWINTSIPRPARSVAQARELLKASGFSWRPDGSLFDRFGQRVTFTIATSATSAQRTAMATLIQADLKELGMDVRVVPLEFRALVDRVFETFDYDATVQGFGGGDADPNAEMGVWLSSGANHMWRLGQKTPATPWEAEIDRLMQQQLSTLDAGKRKALYDRVQTIVAEQAAVHLPGRAPHPRGRARRSRELQAGGARSLHAVERGRALSHEGCESTPMSMLAHVLDAGQGPRTDRELVAACVSGDEQAWSELIDRYNRLIFSIPLKQGLDRDQAADIFQAVCLDLVAELPRLRDPQALPKWLIQTTLHKVSKWRRRSERFVADGDERAEQAEAPETDMPDAFIREVQQAQAMREAVSGLSDRCRQMVQMLFFETPPRPYKDVASRLGVATGSIGFLRGRCLDRLRSALEGIGLCR